MNLACPICGGIALSVPRKLWSSRVFPARCRRCSALVAQKRTLLASFVESGLDHILFGGAAIVALVLWSWWPLIVALAVGFAVVPVIFSWSTPLVAFTREEVSYTRRVALIAAAVFIALLVIAGLTDR